MTTATRQPALDAFSPATREWFAGAFEAPTKAQELGWKAISGGKHTLILAPTGSGKTLAAFLWCLDRLFQSPPREAATKRTGARVLYISPLKALTYDIERNLRAPLTGIALAAERLGTPVPQVEVAVRTGDTPQEDRRRIQRNPPDILITTPESLYLMLTSQVRDALKSVEWVIVDEIHTMSGTKRGAHLALSLERLEELTAGPAQRIGLSATQRPLEESARYLGGGGREVEIVDAGHRKDLDLEVIVPIPDMAAQGERMPLDQAPGGAAAAPEARHSIWPAIYPRLLELIRQHRSTLIFANSRRLAERLAQRLNELAGEELVRAHHGSVSREQRVQIEEQLKAGKLPALVATSSLELGIDMGAIDLVIQVESPTSVASGLQRIGRSGHRIDEVSRGKIFPKFRGDLVECAVVTRRMREGQIEETIVPRNPLDVLAQQVVAMCAMDEWKVDDLLGVVRRAYSFADLSREGFEGVLGMLSGQYPSDEFAELRPRIVWDRAADTLISRGDAKAVAISNAGTIPDRGLFGVFLGEGGPRVGELDEEMVYESRAGETFLLGATTWRIEEITRDRVIVSPAPGEPGKMPFWKGDGPGRPIELGRALGAFVREIDRTDPETAMLRLREDHDLDQYAADNLLSYLKDQKEATGVLPTDRTIVVERFRDELGDWRVCILTPFGGRVHAPWALAIEAQLSERTGFDVQALWSDDGIAIRLPEAEDSPLDTDVIIQPEAVEDLVLRQLGSSALFASRFRENAARALLLPRRRPGSRTPLWQQRQRAGDLLAVASRYGSFPIILETYRECLREVFDMPALVEVLRSIQRRDIKVVAVETRSASPFATSLLFDYIAAYMYEGDAPLAERRAQALALDRELLRELMGQEELRELLDPEAVADLELELQALVPARQAKSADTLHDLLRRIGDLSREEVHSRCRGGAEPADDWLAQLDRQRRACAIRIAGEERWIAVEDAARYRDALGASLPTGIPDVFLAPAEEPLHSLLARWARTHAPLLERGPTERWGLPTSAVHEALQHLVARETLLYGDFRPDGHDREYCDPEVLRSLKRRSLARLRREVEPVPAEALGRFLPAWHEIGSERGGLDRLADVVTQLEGYAIPASVLERDVLPARIKDYTPRLLDELGAAGELVWVGRGSLGRDDGRVALYRRDRVGTLLSPQSDEKPDGVIHAAIREHLAARGASFFREIYTAAGGGRDDDVLDALWELVWAGEVTNDTFSPLRALRYRRPRGNRVRPGRLSQVGPPEAAGRWSLVSSLVNEATSPTARQHAVAGSLLERYGVVTREAVLAEGTNGGFSGVYPVYRAMEESGRIRRGYFVEGLGAAQFALPGAVDRLRAERDQPDERRVVLLAASDAANPYGAAIAWPRRGEDDRRPLQRAAGAYIVLVDGRAALYLERGGRGIITLSEDEEVLDLAIPALRPLVSNGHSRGLVIERLDGEPAREAAIADRFTGAGFVKSYKGLVLRA
ncbi:MAG: DEAD/DEAH box helicase [Dehalococcoidia bacterium]